MSQIVARMQKLKNSNLGGIYYHNERIFKNHSNKKIDPSKTHLNYELTDRNKELTYKKQITDFIDENKVSSRSIRKDAVMCNEWIITSDSSFFKKLDNEEIKCFFETSKDFFEKKYGKENIAFASVHMDESTPHMHLGIVPMVEGKLSSKQMFNREELLKIQNDLPKYLNENGYDIYRGKEGSTAKHLTVKEYKELQSQLEEKTEKVNDAKHELANIQNKLVKNKRELGKLSKVLESNDKIQQNWDNELAIKKKKLPFGKEQIVMDPKSYNKIKSSYLDKEMKVAKLEQDIFKLRNEMIIEKSKGEKYRNIAISKDRHISDLTKKQQALQNKYKKLLERFRIMCVKSKRWREFAKKHTSTPLFKSQLLIVNSLNPIKLIVSVVQQINKVMDKNI